MPRHSPPRGHAKRRHQPPAPPTAVTQPAPPAPEQLQRDKEQRLRQVAAAWQTEFDRLLREEQAEWSAETGQPMPTKALGLLKEARSVMTREELRDAEQQAEKNAGESFGYEQVKVELSIAKIRADREDARRIAVGVEVVKQTAAIVGPAIADTTDADGTKSSGVEYNVDALIVETLDKLKRDKGDMDGAIEHIRTLGWGALADTIAEATGKNPSAKTLWRHRKKSRLLREWAAFRPSRGGKSAPKPDANAAVDIAGAAGQLVTTQRSERLVKQRPDVSQDPRSDAERRQHEAEAKWFEQGKPGKCTCGDPPARLRNGRPWCEECYAEKFEGETPEVIGNRPR